MYSGRLITQTHMMHYLLTAFTPFLVVCFDTTSGMIFKCILRHWVGKPVLRLTICIFLFLFCHNISLTTDDRADSVPPWRGLNHFTTYLAVEFTDGSKWEDMSKVCCGQHFNMHYSWISWQICVPVMWNTLEADENGYHLLCAVRAYVELDLLASFEVHTDDTIKYDRAMVNRFVKLANVSHLFCT